MRKTEDWKRGDKTKRGVDRDKRERMKRGENRKRSERTRRGETWGMQLNSVEEQFAG